MTGYAHSLQTVFLWAVPVAGLAFALTWILPEVPLRQDHGGDRPGRHPGPDLHPPHRARRRRDRPGPVGPGPAGEPGGDLPVAGPPRPVSRSRPAACWLLLRVDGHEEPARPPSWPTISMSRRPPSTGWATSWPVGPGRTAGRPAAVRSPLRRAGPPSTGWGPPGGRAWASSSGAGRPSEHDEVVQMVARLASDLMSNALADPAMVTPPGPTPASRARPAAQESERSTARRQPAWAASAARAEPGGEGRLPGPERGHLVQ